jgi:ribulose-5-phosphate 4-epimerase/fuculose-1-phosphate aldolase
MVTNTTPQTQIINELKSQVALSCRIIGNNGVTRGSLGHVSVRVPGTDVILIKGRGPDVEGMEYATERDVITINIKGELLEAREGIQLPAETSMHLAVLRRRPEIQSVIHAHPDWVVVLTSAGKPLVPILNAYDGGGSARLVQQGVPVYPRSMTITTDELGDDMMKSMGNSNVLFLFGHGTCVAGTSVENATSTNLTIYELARINCLTYAIGTPQGIDPADLGGGAGAAARGGGGMGGGGGRPGGGGGGQDGVPDGLRRANTPSGMSSFWRYELKRLPALPPEPTGRAGQHLG